VIVYPEHDFKHYYGNQQLFTEMKMLTVAHISLS